MATVHLIEGPVGAGKSTYAARLALNTGAVHLNLDEWMVTLFSPDRPADGFVGWYGARKERCIEQIWRVAGQLMDVGVDAVLELGLVQRTPRAAFYGRIDAAGYPLKVTVLDASEPERQRRVLARNESGNGTFRMVVSQEIFAMANRAWQPPDDEERRTRNIEEVWTGS